MLSPLSQLVYINNSLHIADKFRKTILLEYGIWNQSVNFSKNTVTSLNNFDAAVQFTVSHHNNIIMHMAKD